jgi:Bacterial archaeo-eukaryotic release factor family 10
MITVAEVQKLRAVRAPLPSVLSLYLQVPMSLPALRDLPARADELLAEAVAATNGRPGVTAYREERRTVRRLLEVHARAWLGYTIAIFAASNAGLAEAFPLPCSVAERAVLGARPHVRPLLAALQRCPAYHVVVLDQQYAWVLRITGTRIDAMVASPAPGVRNTGFGGWYGLGHRQLSQHITQLAGHRFDDTGASMKQALLANARQPLVIGGYQDAIPGFLAALPDDIRDRYAGRFTAEASTMTADGVREQSAAVIGRWVSQREHDAATQILAGSAGGLAALGLGPCLAAVNSHAVQVLAVPTEGLIPGFACELCGMLAGAPTGCPHATVTAHPVPDLLEEMVAATLDDGGEVVAMDDPPASIAARRRFSPGTETVRSPCL